MGDSPQRAYQWTATRHAQKKAARLIAGGMKKGAAAAIVGVTNVTVSRWMRKTEFVKMIEYYREHTREAVIEELKGASAIATRRIVETIEDLDAPRGLRHRAALDLLAMIGISAKQIIEHTGADGGPIQLQVQAQVQEIVRILPTLSVEQLRALAQANPTGLTAIERTDLPAPVEVTADEER